VRLPLFARDSRPSLCGDGADTNRPAFCWATGVVLVISDKCLGLVEALGEFYPEADWQRCMVHWFPMTTSCFPFCSKKMMAVITNTGLRS
jgi:hypothetical protein